MMMIPFFILNILFNGRLTKKGSINYYENNADSNISRLGPHFFGKTFLFTDLFTNLCRYTRLTECTVY